MGNRSGKRLPNWVRKANRKARLKLQQGKKPSISSHRIPSGYFDIHMAIKNYARHYLNAYHTQKSFMNLVPGASIRSIYIREPMECGLMLDLHKVEYQADWCTIHVRYHQEKKKRTGLRRGTFNIMADGCGSYRTEYNNRYRYSDPLHFSEIFANPNFFDLFRVFLDECLLKYWGCGAYSHDVAAKGGIIKYCISDLEGLLDDAKDTRIVEIERSDGPLDEPSAFDVQMNGSSVGVLSALDGYLRFDNHRTIQKTAAWVAEGHIRGFTSLVAAEIRHDNSRSSDTGLYSVPQGEQ